MIVIMNIARKMLKFWCAVTILSLLGSIIAMAKDSFEVFHLFDCRNVSDTINNAMFCNASTTSFRVSAVLEQKGILSCGNTTIQSGHNVVVFCGNASMHESENQTSNHEFGFLSFFLITGNNTELLEQFYEIRKELVQGFLKNDESWALTPDNSHTNSCMKLSYSDDLCRNTTTPVLPTSIPSESTTSVTTTKENRTTTSTNTSTTVSTVNLTTLALHSTEMISIANETTSENGASAAAATFDTTKDSDQSEEQDRISSTHSVASSASTTLLTPSASQAPAITSTTSSLEQPYSASTNNIGVSSESTSVRSTSNRQKANADFKGSSFSVSPTSGYPATNDQSRAETSARTSESLTNSKEASSPESDTTTVRTTSTASIMSSTGERTDPNEMTKPMPPLQVNSDDDEHDRDTGTEECGDGCSSDESSGSSISSEDVAFVAVGFIVGLVIAGSILLARSIRNKKNVSGNRSPSSLRTEKTENSSKRKTVFKKRPKEPAQKSKIASILKVKEIKKGQSGAVPKANGNREPKRLIEAPSEATEPPTVPINTDMGTSRANIDTPTAELTTDATIPIH